MRRTTIYLEPDLEVLLKLETQRQQRPMAELIREAVRAYVTRAPQTVPPGAGAFASGRADTAERADDLLAESGFGRAAAQPRRATTHSTTSATRRTTPATRRSKSRTKRGA